MYYALLLLNKLCFNFILHYSYHYYDSKHCEYIVY